MANRDHALVKNAADPRQVKWAARKEKQREAEFIASVEAVMKTLEGRRVFGELLERAGLYKSSYDHSGSTTYFNEGRRNFGLEIQASLVQASEDLYIEMEREMRAMNRAIEREAIAVQSGAAPEGASNGR